MKIEIIKGCIFMLIGAYLFARFIPDTGSKQPEVSQIQQQQQECKVVVRKVTKSDGSVDEVTEFLAKNQQKQEQKIEIKKQNKYFAGLSREYDFENQKDAYEIHLGRNVTENVGVFFSYNSEQVAGLGLRLEF